MTKVSISVVLTLALALFGPAAIAQQQPEQPWSASWINDPSSDPNTPGVYHFRKEFELAAQSATFPIRVSADNRYRLYVNGIEVSNGPARGDLLHWRYESVDIATHLRPGKNVIAALVWNMGEFKPAAQISLRTALVVQGDSPDAAFVSTGTGGWKVFSSRAYTFKRVEGDDTGGFYVAGPREDLDASKMPWGWEQPDFDAGGWTEAKPIVQQFASPVALARGTQVNGSAAEWQLVPRNIPLPEQAPVRFASVRRAEGVTVPAGFAAGKQALIVPPRAKATLLLDQGALTVGYPVMITTGGADAKATIIYAESLFDAAGNKGNRGEIEGKTIRGLRDTIRFDGGEGRRFQSLWLRTWRYVQVEIETGDQPLRIDSIEGIFAAYPFKQKAAFDSDAKWIKPVWDMNWRALRMSAFETFWDTPYYEQLQYVGDTRIEALMSVYQTGDDRLMRSAIEQFDDSRTSEGLTASSYPSSLRQQIPPFSLWWVAMVHDYWMLRGDPAFVRGRLQGMRDVLDWFERHVDDTGLLGPMPWWNYLDWAKGYPNGIPPGGGKGHSVAITLQFVLALQQAAELEQAHDRPEDARRCLELANRIIATLRTTAWDEGRGLFVDSLEAQSFSQQTNALAILTQAVPDGMKTSVAEKMLADKDLEPATFYFRFYVDEAMRSAGLADRYLSRLGPWQEMIRNGMTTTAETPEPTRSDSHAWAAHPNYQLLATVLGIRPAASGFERIAITPALGTLKFAKGQMPHPEGEIRASYRQDKDKLFADLTLPPSVSGDFVWRSAKFDLKGGRNAIVCTADICRPVETGNLRPVGQKGD
jgi:alpha-L-rhamnosidase